MVVSTSSPIHANRGLQTCFLASEATEWWAEFARHDPFVGRTNEPETLRVDAGRWVSFGYVTARK